MPEYIFPTNLRVSSPFGMRPGGFHWGIDFSDGAEGHPIHAVADGEVTYEGFEPSPSFGNTITITHAGGIKSGYGHLRDRALFRKGDHVRQGDVIGFVGNTGGSRGAHLHLWMGATPNGPGTLNPGPLLSPTSTPTPPPVPFPDLSFLEDDMYSVVSGPTPNTPLYQVYFDPASGQRKKQLLGLGTKALVLMDLSIGQAKAATYDKVSETFTPFIIDQGILNGLPDQ